MHSAPSVSYPVGRSSWGARLAAALWLAGLAVTVAWCVQLGVAEGGGGWRPWLSGAVLLACGVLVRRDLRRHLAAPQHLRWDGAQWHWLDDDGRRGADEPPAGRLSVHLDLQAALLLCFHDAASGRRRWAWAERAAQPERWRDLRRAVYSPASRPAPEATDRHHRHDDSAPGAAAQP